MESRTRVSSYLGFVSWMSLHLGIDDYSGTRTQYPLLQTPTRVPPYLGLASWMYLHLRVDVHS
ncbi:unnamed protein product [Schistosoma curassoni]|uniref:Ovule protein n=1 Tax=Schistosoma curassoni TaxID=6186 RepID=A0A183K5Q9_9TREM|nr:unnamed protein product [Schistosoma curassoni]